MQNNWEPRVGQKVAALTDSDSFKKDEIFKVLAVRKACPHFTIDIGLKSPLTGRLECEFCGQRSRIGLGDVWWIAAAYFAPIISAEYPDATAEIAQQFKEHPDTVDQPVKVLGISN